MPSPWSRGRRSPVSYARSTSLPLSPGPVALAAMDAMSPDALAIKQAIELVRHREVRQATQLEKSVRDPMAQKLIEWVVLRSEESGAGFDRYAAFIRDNATWPTLALL